MAAKMNVTEDTPLTPREQMFCDAYRGNARQAALEAGCTEVSAATLGWRMFHLPNVRKEIARLGTERVAAGVMDRDEMQRLFSSTARDPLLPMRERLVAAQLLGKTRGDFSEKLEVKGDLTLHQLVLEATGGKE